MPRRLVYNDLNQMITETRLNSGSALSYTYDGLGRRFAKYFTGVKTRHIWEGDEITYYDYITEGGDVLHGRDYIHGLYAEGMLCDGIYANLLNVHGDVLGTVCVNSTLDPVKTTVYDAYGRVIQSQGNFEKPYGYAGEYTDEGGLQYLRARYYDLGTGRFTQEDTYRGLGNLYAYCGGNPVAFTDPSGHCHGYPDVREKETVLTNSELIAYQQDPNLSVQVIRTAFTLSGGQFIPDLERSGYQFFRIPLHCSEGKAALSSNRMQRLEMAA